MSSETLHAPRERLSSHTLAMHQAIVSLMEELEAADWYRQRADDCDDPKLKEILLHNMGEEVEHAAMILEWLRRNDPRFDKELREYLFTENDIVEVERQGHVGRYRAHAVPGPHPRVDELLREKYGIANRWVRFLSPDNEKTVAVRLDPL